MLAELVVVLRADSWVVAKAINRWPTEKLRLAGADERTC